MSMKTSLVLQRTGRERKRLQLKEVCGDIVDILWQGTRPVKLSIYISISNFFSLVPG